MPLAQTINFGTISYHPDAAICFPKGLPAFEERRNFVVLQFQDSAPLTFIQSLETPDLCFVAMPVLAIEPQYRLEVSREDLEELGLASDRQPRMGVEVLCLTIVSLGESGPTANLLAPVVVNIRNRKAVQAVAGESGYSHQHALFAQEVVAC
jgi:flagellar assembly factor FliW